MSSVGVRELKSHVSEILRRVRENGETIEVTLRGEVVAEISPVRRRPTADERKAFWDRQRSIVRQIADGSDGSPLSAVELVREQRRNLSPDEWIMPDRLSDS